MFRTFGPLEIILVLVVLLVVFGPKRLPGLGKSLGSGMREFKDSITGKDDEAEEQPTSVAGLPAAPAEPTVTPAEPKATPDSTEAEPAEVVSEPRG